MWCVKTVFEKITEINLCGVFFYIYCTVEHVFPQEVAVVFTDILLQEGSGPAGPQTSSGKNGCLLGLIEITVTD